MHIAIVEKILGIVNSMPEVTLEEMDHVQLMRRKDTKFVLPFAKLLYVLKDVEDKYRVLEISNERFMPYQTLYYDTPCYEMYRNHHNGRLNRYKVRVRTYGISGVAYLEIKFKNNKGETIKKRIAQNGDKGILGDENSRFLSENSPYSSHDIVPTLQNQFKRITLVNKISPERVTIDFGLQFDPKSGESQKDIPDIAIIEVKRDRDAGGSDMMTALRENRIKAMGFSKYCMGTAMTHDDVRKNLFKRKLRVVNKMKLSNTI